MVLKAKCNKIKKEVAKRHMVTIQDIDGRSRKEEIVFARDEAIFRCRKETKANLSTIGRIFNRSHTTIMHSLKKQENGAQKPVS